MKKNCGTINTAAANHTTPPARTQCNTTSRITGTVFPPCRHQCHHGEHDAGRMTSGRCGLMPLSKCCRNTCVRPNCCCSRRRHLEHASSCRHTTSASAARRCAIVVAVRAYRFAGLNDRKSPLVLYVSSFSDRGTDDDDDDDNEAAASSLKYPPGNGTTNDDDEAAAFFSGFPKWELDINRRREATLSP